jgi:hypothetical protein
MSRRVTIVIGGALAVGALMPATDALAGDMYSEVKDRVAAWSGGNHSTVTVKDWGSDGHPVKAEYNRTNSANLTQTLTNTKGYGTTTTSVSGSAIFTLRACHYSGSLQNHWCGPWSDA